MIIHTPPSPVRSGSQEQTCIENIDIKTLKIGQEHIRDSQYGVCSTSNPVFGLFVFVRGCVGLLMHFILPLLIKVVGV